MSLAPPTDASTYNQEGAWNPNVAYEGTSSPNGKADEVEYLGAYWYATYDTSASDPGYGVGWALDKTGPSPNYAPVVPEAPTGLTAGYKSSSSVALFWDQAVIEGLGSVSSYNVYENGSLIASTQGNSFTVNGLAAHTNYVFSVSASDQFGTSGTGAVWNYGHTINYNAKDPGPNPTLTVQTQTKDPVSSGKTFSPYLDMTQPAADIENISEATGMRDFTLAFMQTSLSDITATSVDPQSGRPTAGTLTLGVVPTLSFGGLDANTLPAGQIIQEVKDVAAEGGTITVSIGGYTGFDPALIATEYMANLEAGDPSLNEKPMNAAQAQKTAIANLEQEYQSILTTYGVNHLDFDVENAATVNNTEANHLRDLAVKQLEASNPGLSVTYTLAVLPHGLSTAYTNGSSDDYRVLQQAKADGVSINVVNLMTMDYDDGAKNMLAAAESAATATEAQLQKLGLTSTINITPMIGQNDDYGANDPSSTDKVDEVFTTTDARALAQWAAGQSYVSGLGEWELTRDMASTADTTGTEPTETTSGVIQTAYEFSDYLKAITTSTGSTGSVNSVDASLLRQASAAFVPSGALASTLAATSASMMANPMFSVGHGLAAHAAQA